jgi:hypothetical protein
VSSVDWELDLWTVVGEQFSAVPDVEYPWDPTLVRRIREFDRNYVPLFCRRAYKVPGRGIRVYGYHMMGRRLTAPREEIEPLRLLLPAGGKWAGIDLRGTVVEATVWEGPKPAADKPGAFIPFTEQLVHSARRAWWEVKYLEARVRKDLTLEQQRTTVRTAVRDVDRDLWAERVDLHDYRERQPVSVQVSPKLERIRSAADVPTAA